MFLWHIFNLTVYEKLKIKKAAFKAAFLITLVQY